MTRAEADRAQLLMRRWHAAGVFLLLAGLAAFFAMLGSTAWALAPGLAGLGGFFYCFGQADFYFQLILQYGRENGVPIPERYR